MGNWTASYIITTEYKNIACMLFKVDNIEALWTIFLMVTRALKKLEGQENSREAVMNC